jgi:DNA-binding MarR family transcriptional regulator
VAEPTLMYVIKQVELASRARLDELFRPIGLTALQYTALTVLARHPGMSSSQLARNSFVTAQSIADMVAALEARGLIERHRDASDRRRLVLALTGEQEQQLRDSLEVCRANLAGRPPAAEK